MLNILSPDDYSEPVIYNKYPGYSSARFYVNLNKFNIEVTIQSSIELREEYNLDIPGIIGDKLACKVTFEQSSGFTLTQRETRQVYNTLRYVLPKLFFPKKFDIAYFTDESLKNLAIVGLTPSEINEITKTFK